MPSGHRFGASTSRRATRTLGSLKRISLLLWSRRSTAITLATPLVLLPLLVAAPDGLTLEASRCLYLLLLMAVYWMTEAIDISATALLPLPLLPLLGIMKTSDVAKSYQKDTIMLLIGGFLVAVAVESSNIHKRISVAMLRLAGSNMRMLMLGFMVPTWFLSMWMSNTATTAVMVPILKAVIDDLKRAVTEEALDKDESTRRENSAVDVSMGDSQESIVVKSTMALKEVSVALTEERSLQEKNNDWLNVHRALALCVCYSSTIGGMATLTGNPTNIVLLDNLQLVSQRHGNYNFDMNFVTWMVLGLPISVLLLVSCWLLLQVIHVGFGHKRSTEEQGARIKVIVDKEYRKLGPVTFNEVVVVIMVVFLVALWLSRDPGNVGGWQQLFKKGYVSDTTAVMLVGVLLFVVPARRPAVGPNDDGMMSGPSPGCLTWKAVHEKMPWGVVILIGGGFALAEAIEVSGLAVVIGHVLGQVLSGLQDWILVLTISAICALVTQMTSNTTVATLFLPIVAFAAEEDKIHPLYIMFPACISTSFAFVLPVATPSNAIVFATGTLRIIDMAKGGVILTVVAIFISTLATTTWGKSYFHMESFPFDSVQNASSSTDGSIYPSGSENATYTPIL